MFTLTFIYIASGLCAVGLFAYLGYALIRAEKFQGVRHVQPDVYWPLPGVFCCDRHGRSGQPVHLTPIEYRLLCAMIRGQSRVLTHRQLLLEVWGLDYVDRAHYLRVHMAHLRQKLEADPAQPQYFITELQVGYRLVGL